MNIIWGTCSKELLHELEVIQNRILKIIFNLPFRIHTKDLNIFTHTKPITVCIYRDMRYGH
ncbi:hypothetical protein C0J52_03824 [Blattella germanica]|nr:hypothetical protein C0J52_03824 [Blattella germanica]